MGGASPHLPFHIVNHLFVIHSISAFLNHTPPEGTYPPSQLSIIQSRFAVVGFLFEPGSFLEAFNGIDLDIHCFCDLKLRLHTYVGLRIRFEVGKAKSLFFSYFRHGHNVADFFDRQTELIGYILLRFVDSHLLGDLQTHYQISGGAYAAHAGADAVCSFLAEWITYAYLQSVYFTDFDQAFVYS